MTYVMTSTKGKDIMDNILPPYYSSSRIMSAEQDAIGAELDMVLDALESAAGQFFVDMADWYLSGWEDELGLPTNLALTDTERRARITSRLRGTGTVTIKVMKQIADSYVGGDVEILEDFPKYTVYVMFISIQGIPSNITDLQTVLRDIVPAHIDIQYIYNYMTWDELDAEHLTWDQLDALALTWDKFETYK